MSTSVSKYSTAALAIFPLLLTILIFWLINGRGPITFGSLDLSRAQYLFFPFVCLALWWGGLLRISAATLGLAMAGYLCGFAGNFYYAGTPHNNVAIVRFQDDPLEVETHKFREALQKRFKVFSNLQAQRFPDDLTTLKDVEAAMQKIRSGRAFSFHAGATPVAELKAAIWGGLRRVYMVFSGERVMTLAQATHLPEGMQLGRLELIASVPQVGLSFQPQQYTQEFAARTLAGTLPSVFQAPEQPSAEAHLLYAAGMIAGWTSFAHRAFPWWVLANRYLAEGLSGGDLSEGSIRCAHRAFEMAKKYLRRGDNPALEAAILNNQGVLLVSLGTLKKEKKFFKAGMKKFKAAMRIAHGDKDLWQIARFEIGIAANNIGHAKGLLGKKHEKRRDARQAGVKKGHKKGQKKVAVKNPAKKKVKKQKGQKVNAQQRSNPPAN